MAKTQQVECPYCRGTGIGTYWLHSLNDTIDTECHWCEGMGTCTPSAVKLCCMHQLDETRVKEYRAAHPELFQ